MILLIFLAITLAVIVYIYEDDAPVKEKLSHKTNHNPLPYRETHIIPDAVLQLTIDEHIKQLPKQAEEMKSALKFDTKNFEAARRAELELFRSKHQKFNFCPTSKPSSPSIMFYPI